MKLAASLDINGNKIKDGDKVYSMPSVAGTLAVLSDIPKGSFVIMGTATAISQDKTILTVDGEPVIASQSNLGHVYQLGEDELVSNGEEWIVLGAEIDLSEYQQKTDQLLTTVDKTVVGAINELKEDIDDIIAGSTDLTNYYTKEETDQEIEEVAYVSAQAFAQIKETLGTDNSLKVSFEELQFLNSSTSILNAIQLIDGLVNTLKTEIANIDVKKNLPIKVVGLSGAYTIKLAGEIGGGEYTIEGNTLICGSDAIESNILVLSGGAIEGNRLVL